MAREEATVELKLTKDVSQELAGDTYDYIAML